MKMRALLIYICIFLAVICKFPETVSSDEGVQASFGALAYADATTLFQQRSFDEASEAFWKAIMKHSHNDPFTVSRYLKFMRSATIPTENLNYCAFNIIVKMFFLNFSILD
jgi:hypothetical protein